VNIRLPVLLAWSGLGLASAALALGFAQTGAWVYALVIMTLLLLGGLTARYRLRWAAPLVFTTFLMMAVVALWSEMWPGWPLLGVLGALVAADMLGFTWRVNAAMTLGDDYTHLENRHLRRLGLVIVLGGVLYLIAWLIQVRLNFGLALLLGLTAVLGISVGLSARRRAHE
jgi:hypothetical protein